MRVLRLYIQECGVFERTLIDFTHKNKAQDILCIAGVNGTGKTTVIELVFNLILLLNPSLSPRDIFYDRLKPNVLTRVKFAQLDILIDNHVISLVVGSEDEFQKHDDNLKQDYIIEPELSSLILQIENSFIKVPEDEEDINFKVIEYHIKKSFREDKFSERKSIKNISIFKNLIVKIQEALDNSTSLKNITTEELPFIYFFNAHDREITDIRYSSIPKEKPEYKLAHRYNPKKDDLKKILIYYEYAYQHEFNELKKWINDHVLVDKSIDRIDRPNFGVVVKAKNGQEHGLELLSSGEESLLIIAIQFYLKAHKNSIFIIDEIDQSLHPEFQEKVIHLIKKLQKEKGCQIIISSHSEIIWNFFNTQGLIDLTEMVL